MSQVTPEAACPQEDGLLAALRAGELNEPLRRHAETCKACGQAVLLFALMRESVPDQVAVPPAGLIWWKSQQRARREAMERALRPVILCERLVAGAVLVVAAASGAWMISQPSVAWLGGVALASLAMFSGGVIAWAGRRK